MKIALALALALGLAACQGGAADTGLAACQADLDCPLGSLCDGVRCVAGCRSSRDCPRDLACDTHHQPYGECVRTGAAGAADAAPPSGTPADAAPAGGPDAGCTPTWIPILRNNGFEDGHWVWVEQPRGVIYEAASSDPIQPFEGQWLAALGKPSYTQAISQSFTIPPAADLLEINGEYLIATADGTQWAYDTGAVELDLPQTTVLQVSNLTSTPRWTFFEKRAIDVTAARGQVATLTAWMTNDGTDATYLVLDGLHVWARVCQ